MSCGERSVNKETNSGMNDRVSIPGRGSNCLFLATTYTPAIGRTQSCIEDVQRSSVLGVMRPEREADNSTAYSNDVKYLVFYLHSPIRLRGVRLKYRGNFTCYLHPLQHFSFNTNENSVSIKQEITVTLLTVVH